MALALVGCNKEVADIVSPSIEGQTAMLKVNLKAAGTMTKAGTATENFEYGSTTENTINNATFYFFDAVGGAYTVAPETNAVTVNAKDLNRVPSEEGKADANVEAYSDVILVIKGSQQTPPAKMVALINVDPATYNNMPLADLEAAASAIKTGDHFVMSNSSYADVAGKVVTATEILPENIFVNPDPTGNVGDKYEIPEGAEVVPVNIYVERVAAKVRVNVSATDAKELEGGVKIYPVTDVADTYVKVLGWDVTNAATTSYLIKKYATTNLFSPVNNPAFFRSYWANTIASANPTHGFAFNAITKPVGAEAYYHENTLTPVNGEGWFNSNATEGATKASQLIVAAQLVDAAGNPKEFAKWYGQDYANGNALQAAMINNAAKQIFVVDEENSTEGGTTAYKGIGIADVTFYQVDYTTDYNPGTYSGDRRYEVRVKATTGTKYYKQTGVNEVAEMTEADVNAILNKIEPAMIWASGNTYYYTLIDHFGADGMVRNHIYDVKITAFKGLGTPVYDPEQVIVPEIPVEQEAYHLTAQINVLSWNLVSQDVELGF